MRAAGMTAHDIEVRPVKSLLIYPWGLVYQDGSLLLTILAIIRWWQIEVPCEQHRNLPERWKMESSKRRNARESQIIELYEPVPHECLT